MSTPLGLIGICNLALSRIGVLKPITSLTDGTPAANALNLAYNQCRQELLHDFPWGWSSKYVLLTQLSSNTANVNFEWTYSYVYPSDCLMVRRLQLQPQNQAPLTTPPLPLTPTWDRADTDAYPVPYEVGYDGTTGQQVIYCDFQNVVCKYTFDQGDTAPFTPEFANIFAWRLAMEVSFPLANSEERRTKAEQMYEKTKGEGASHALNEQQNSKPFQPYNTQSIRGRFQEQ